MYPVECYVQRQQLKFLLKILHLGDLALQRIVLHSNLDPQYNQGRVGRQRNYKKCIIDAMGAFGVTVAQCMEMEQQDGPLIVAVYALLLFLARFLASDFALRLAWSADTWLP